MSAENKHKSHAAALLLSFFLGGIGVDRFYLGHVGVGITKILVAILTLGVGAFVWWIIDFVLIATKNVKNVTWAE